jgi:hypothetical protein
MGYHTIQQKVVIEGGTTRNENPHKKGNSGAHPFFFFFLIC